ncbi:mevalonate kinase-like [Nylanderia fulva]|uniref:mevalonate kinase-like n=1 Tax=Nylanderia fulva TaxID=613905 RepID=UPI0010FB93F8|nr:mevalonate kinase-like [Nylanderia fulva]
MIQFKISAPGKLILCGDNLAMYKKMVVAASLDLRTRLEFCELSDNVQTVIKIEFPDVNLSLTVPLELVLNFFIDFNSDVTDHLKLLKHVQYFITANGMWTTHEQRFSLQTFFFLFIYMIHSEDLKINPFRVHVTTELPLAAGLGSSSSFAACLAGCFLQWGRLQIGESGKFKDIDIENISEYVKDCEEVIQNYVIQADHDVCSYGQIVRYYYHNRYKGIKILNVPRMKIMLIDSQISKSKREQIEQMATQFCNKPTNNILNIMNNMSKQVAGKLSKINDMNAYRLRFTYDALQILIVLNQQFLSYLGMSHPRLDYICKIAKMYGFAGKLTNFDARYAYILLPPDTPSKNIINLSTRLITEGFTVRITNVSCDGVRICD